MRYLVFISVLLATFVHAPAQNLKLIQQLQQRMPGYTAAQKVRALDSIALEYRYINADSCIRYTYLSMDIAKQLGDTNNVGYACSVLGSVYRQKGEYDTAIYYYTQSIKYQEIIFFKRGIAGNYNNIGTIYRLQGKYPLSLRYFKKSLDIFRDVNDDYNTANVLQNMVDLMIEAGRDADAQDLLDENERFYRGKNHTIGMAMVAYARAEVFRHEKKYALSQQYTNMALNMFSGQNRNFNVSQCLLLGAANCIDLQQESRADSMVTEALKLVVGPGFKIEQARAYVLKAHILLNRGRLNPAWTYALNAYKLTEKANRPLLARDAAYILWQVAEKQQRYKDAFTFHKTYAALHDSLTGIEKSRTFEELQTRYNVAEKQQQITRLHDNARIQDLENSRQKLETQRQRLLTVYLFAGIVVVLLFALLFIYRYAQKQRLSKRLGAALKERDILLKEVHHRVKNNLQIISSLLNLQQEMGQAKTVNDMVHLTQDRIYTMSVIHEKLYRSDDLENISLEDYIASMVEYYIQSYDLAQKNIAIKTVVASILAVGIDQLITLGLILNELLVNSIKYAFDKAQPGTITIECVSQGEFIIFTVWDNGKGLPADFDQKKTHSLGMQLIEGLSKQLKAKPDISGNNGTRVTLTFKAA